MAEVVVERELFGKDGDLGADAAKLGRVGAVVEGVDDPPGDGAHFGLVHATGGEGGGADADAGGLEGRVLIVGNGVFVDGDAGLAKGVLGFGAEDAALEDVDEEDVGVGAAGDDAQAVGGEIFGEDFGVGDNLGDVGAEVGLEGFAKGNGLGGDDVHEGTALLAGEDGAVDRGGELLFAEY